MFFNLTPEAALDGKNFKKYRRLQVALYLCAILAAGYLSFRILFPSLHFEFSFANPSAKSNTLTHPEDENGKKISRGNVPSDEAVGFSASFSGSFSKAIVNFTLDKKSDPLDAEMLSVKKSHSAFLYPEGEPLGFKDGALLRNDGELYLVSAGSLRKFRTAQIATSLGFEQDTFMEVSSEDLRHNPLGEEIADNKEYPEHSTFKIRNDYYVLENGSLKKFIGEKAFLSRFLTYQAIGKDETFLEKYPLSEELAGYEDGSLVSYGDSIYIVSGKILLPFADPIVFVAKGYLWEDVVAAGADEISSYEKGKLITLASHHPQGTIFHDTDNQKYYLIREGQKRILPSENIARTWMHSAPIPVSEKSLGIVNTCRFEKNLWPLRSYSCEVPVENMKDLYGTDYAFSFRSPSKIQLDGIRIEFKKEVSFRNLRFTLGEIFNRIKNNYVGEN